MSGARDAALKREVLPRSNDVSLYLDLMKRCLTDSIFIDDPLAHYVPYNIKSETATWKRYVMTVLQRFLSSYRLRLVEPFSDPWVSDYSKLPAQAIAAVRE